MTPLTWIDRLLWWIAPWRWIQCKAELPIYMGVAYCMRTKGHPGSHRTHDGQQFDIGPLK